MRKLNDLGNSRTGKKCGIYKISNDVRCDD